MSEFAIGERLVGTGRRPLLVAEIGANHNGDPKRAEQMVRGLAAAGAELIKFQLYTAEELVADPDRVVAWGPPGKERRERIGELFTRLSLPRPALAELFALGRELGVMTFATPFSESGVEFLHGLGAPCFKIAASDVSHLSLLRAAAQTGKPVILSLGKCTLAEAEVAVETLFAAGCEQLALLHCVAQYPAPIEEMNLSVIPALQHIYAACVIGLSDHSVGETMGVAAVALGARVVEKHVTVSTADEGPDHWFSLPLAEFARYKQALEDAFAALGGARKQILTCEQGERRTSVRSLVAARAVAQGTPLTAADIKVTRPGTGLSPHLLDAVLGLRPSRDLPANTVLTWELFK